MSFDELAKDIRDIPVVAVSGPPVDLTDVLAKHLCDLGYRKDGAAIWWSGYQAGQMNPNSLYPVANPYELTATEGAKPPTVPRAPWLQPDDRTGPEWADKHDERL